MKLFLDTNVYIVGQLQPNSVESKILDWLGLYGSMGNAQVIISQELIDQLLRVGKRLQGKDWSAKLVDQIWTNLDYIFIPDEPLFRMEAHKVQKNKAIPSEDVLIYVSAKLGQADYFISANRQLIKSIADFQCLTAEDFVSQFLQ
jgi:predicted nucleic acid-binding protein